MFLILCEKCMRFGPMKKILKTGIVSVLMILLAICGHLVFLAKSGLQDAHAMRACHPGPTWTPQSWLIAFLRIDCILIPAEFTILDDRAIHLPGSDHRGVVVDIQW